MKGNCLELQAFKIAREKAQTKVYTPPELEKLEERMRSPRRKKLSISRSQYRSTHKVVPPSRFGVRKNSK